MKLKELEVFYLLAETQNVSLSAKKLNFSQGGVSLIIKSLEKKLGVKLFDRIGKKLVLNENGRLFKSKTFDAYEILKSSEYIFKDKKIEGELKFCGSRTINNFVLPEVYYNFKSNYPNVVLNRKTLNSKTIIEKVKNGEIDFGFVEVEFDDEAIVKQKIGSDRLIIVTKDKELTKKEFYIDQLFDKKWILRENGSGTRDMFLTYIDDIKLPIFIESDDICEIQTLLNYKDTITCISEYSVREALRKKEIFEVNVKNIDFKRNFYLIYHKNKNQTLLFEKFMEFVFN